MADHESKEDKPVPGLNTLSAAAMWIALTTFGPLCLVKSFPNALGLAVMFYNNLNILIAFCEIALGIYIKDIQKDYLERKKMYEGKEHKAAFYYLFMPHSFNTVFSAKKWAIMWSTYSLWDPSYQNQESFGFFIDVGNGWSTIPPCLLWNAAILFPDWVQAASPYAWLLVGTIGIASYWQVMYGAIIYFLSFFYNKRHVGRPLPEVLGFVGFANGIWIFFPAFAMRAAWVILRDQEIEPIFR
eukprot:Nitzschia sp. Nitz4//scaffold267_size26297//21472//22197//NITZ4_008272-RA/size26297-processed-gene-0.1-mRNA-1//1//CDS//3329544914//2200//frame0